VELEEDNSIAINRLYEDRIRTRKRLAVSGVADTLICKVLARTIEKITANWPFTLVVAFNTP